MEFRLTYQGPLPPASAGKSQLESKWLVRLALHEQLVELWKTHPRLGSASANPHMVDNHIMKKVGGKEFVPLICSYVNSVCALDILFLRRDSPGSLVHNGDLDNRIKTLFDGLRVPANEAELKTKQLVPNKCYCLVEDDCLITTVKVTTDRLLARRFPTEHEEDVHLVIHVTTIPLNTPYL